MIPVASKSQAEPVSGRGRRRRRRELRRWRRRQSCSSPLGISATLLDQHAVMLAASARRLSAAASSSSSSMRASQLAAAALNPQRWMHDSNKKAMELVAKGWSDLQEVYRVIDCADRNDERLIPLLRGAKENFELALETDNDNTDAKYWLGKMNFKYHVPGACTAVPTTPPNPAVNNLNISGRGDTAGAGAEGHKKNLIQVSKTQKPLFFYINLAKRYMQLHNEVELRAIGESITTLVTVAQILKNNGLAVEKKIMTSTFDVNDKTIPRPMRKPMIEILLGKTEKFDELMAAAAEEREAKLGKTEI